MSIPKTSFSSGSVNPMTHVPALKRLHSLAHSCDRFFSQTRKDKPKKPAKARKDSDDDDSDESDVDPDDTKMVKREINGKLVDDMADDEV